jgi:hypothetical protein
MPRILTGNAPTIGLLAVVLALVLGACGSSSGKPSGKPHTDAALAYSRCMRAHGVPTFPDSAGGGINLAGTGINPDSPAFRSAQAICHKLLPGGGPGTHASEQDIRLDVAMAVCMRKHGVPNFPDPIVTSKPPAVAPGQYRVAEYGNGIFIGIPSSINVNSPAFLAAAKTCNFR